MISFDSLSSTYSCTHINTLGLVTERTHTHTHTQTSARRFYEWAGCERLAEAAHWVKGSEPSFITLRDVAPSNTTPMRQFSASFYPSTRFNLRKHVGPCFVFFCFVFFCFILFCFVFSSDPFLILSYMIFSHVFMTWQPCFTRTVFFCLWVWSFFSFFFLSCFQTCEKKSSHIYVFFKIFFHLSLVSFFCFLFTQKK